MLPNPYFGHQHAENLVESQVGISGMSWDVLVMDHDNSQHRSDRSPGAPQVNGSSHSISMDRLRENEVSLENTARMSWSSTTARHIVNGASEKRWKNLTFCCLVWSPRHWAVPVSSWCGPSWPTGCLLQSRPATMTVSWQNSFRSISFTTLGLQSHRITTIQNSGFWTYFWHVSNMFLICF